MKTIEEYNKEAYKSEVYFRQFEITIVWEPSDIMCNCGCEDGELLLETPNMEGNKSTRQKVKCSKTEKVGMMYKDGSVRQIINKIEW